MERNLHDAFDKIHAEAALKEKTSLYLRGEIQRRSRNRRAFRPRLAAACASFLLLLFAGGFSYHLYLTPDTYIDMDVNPSIELTLNRLGRVLEADPYNSDGEVILNHVDVRHKSYEQAVQALLDEMIRLGYLTSDGLVSVTVQTDNENARQKLLGEIQASVDTLLDSHRCPASANVFAVSQEVRNCAHDYNLSPAKYLAITQLQEVDPTASYEKCAGHSISEIRRLTEEHSGCRHAESSTGSENAQQLPSDSPYQPPDSQSSGNSVDEAAPNGCHGHAGDGTHH